MLTFSPHLLGGVYLGWSLGANDAANVFGTAVSSRMVRYPIAVALCALFIIAGAALEGRAGMATIAGLSAASISSATFAAVGAALSITLMTIMRIPSSTSQAVVGAIIGVGLVDGTAKFSGLGKVVICWIGTPIGALLLAALGYRAGAWLFNRLRLSMLVTDAVLRAALVVSGCYGAYALGANNVANVTGVYYASGLLTLDWSVWLGGLSIALGVLTYSKEVMLAVGRSIVKLDAYSALVVVLAEAATVHVYAMIGVPVSTSQAVIGAVLGVGLVKQATAVKFGAAGRMTLGWIATPLIAGLVAAAIHLFAHLRYVP
ncbi:MAG: inorganic phosphate transporter [Deltaproteobacteria bacterium]|nr:inorganic phosphate transporter [Deltaproteobacteria bacterium]